MGGGRVPAGQTARQRTPFSPPEILASLSDGLHRSSYLALKTLSLISQPDNMGAILERVMPVALAAFVGITSGKFALHAVPAIGTPY